MKIFLDANVLFSGANSGSGIHRLIHLLAENHHLITSDYAEVESSRNLSLKRPVWRAEYLALMKMIEVKPGRDRSLTIEIAAKDRPILATAIAEHCDCLVTGDTKDFGHLFGRTVEGVKIMTPLAMSKIIARESTC